MRGQPNTITAPGTAAHASGANRNGQPAALPFVGNSTPALTLEATIAAYLRSLVARNRSAATIRAYQADLSQFIVFVRGTNVTVERPADVSRADITEYLAALGQRQVSGVSRARKLAAIREFFRHLVGNGLIDKSPAAGVETPKKERQGRTWLRPDEYTKLLSLAGAAPRDYAIFQLFLQTGVRVSELCAVRLGDVDLIAGLLRVHGKGQVERVIELERKGIQALKTWLAARPPVLDDHLFLNHYGQPLGERGVRKLVAKYLREAGITKKASPHSFRHTFGTWKAARGVGVYQLKEWLGHQSIATTPIDNLALLPASLLPYKKQWQALANQQPPGCTLIVMPVIGTRQRETF